MLNLIALVILTTLLTELAARRNYLPYWVSRKVLHVVAVGACALATLSMARPVLIGIVAGAELVLLGLILSNQLMREESGRRAWGIVWFPLAFLLLLLAVPDPEMVCFAMLVLALCDPAATVAGKLLARRTYALTGDPKSLPGNLAFLLVFLALAAFFPGAWEGISWPALLGIGLVLATGEALGSRGLDNLIVPLFVAFLLTTLGAAPELERTFLLLLALAVPFCYVLVARRSLTPGGALTAALLGLVVALSLGTVWLLPLFVFLGSSSLLGRLFPSQSAAGDAKQKRPRDATQVMANGGVYGGLALLAGWNPPWLGGAADVLPYCLLVAMAIATADTWSSELGQYFRRPTYDLLRRQRVPPGLSGGVSWAGSAAGLAGALFLSGSCGWLHPGITPAGYAGIALAGFLGMLLDSALGSRWQAKYVHPGPTAVSDTPGPSPQLLSGFPWMTNDLVNFLAILLGVCLFAAALLLLGS
ncbi:DUF92 domain-containing protein [Neolewinella lacunae]|uniref:DUF92 domain-containing protein n=1 Tax=Neolewinella lacunae TaxID=1517758 RepID=A0A923PSE7_9BACT|nr:DUF92 domain-containing protein [Neolewinella lacunae]MBC6995932.1 DUF92 domain-containing protein [Neolewinella lacunae]MDN3635224.1 DUF92 domain-containing protein [Neolewinella lacunae]